MTSKKQSKVAEVKKLNNGLYVRWQGAKKFVLVEDETIAKFIIYSMTTNNTHTTNYPL